MIPSGKRSVTSPGPNAIWYWGYPSGSAGMSLGSWGSYLRPLLPKAQMKPIDFFCRASLENCIHLGIKRGHHLAIPGSSKQFRNLRKAS